MLEALGEGADESGMNLDGAGLSGLPSLFASEPLVSTTTLKAAGSRAGSPTRISAADPVNAFRAYSEASIPVASAEASSSGSAASPRLHRLVEWMDSHALTRSVHKCARYVREAFEAAGLSTSDRPASGAAGDYGPYLMRHGAQAVEVDASYQPKAGDTAVFEKTAQHPYGHIEVFDGERWVSDFRQQGFSPYRDAATTPAFQVYRLP